MSKSATPISDPYRVQAGDTLGTIARRCSRSVTDLVKLNGLASPDRIEVGQTLYLSERSAYGVSVLFLDALRHPIQNLQYRLCYDGGTMHGKTAETGLAPRQVTRNAQSSVEVWICNAEQQWQQVAQTVSGVGHKLITLVSGALVIKAKTELHPAGAPLASGESFANVLPKNQQAPLPKAVSGAPTKNNPAVRTRSAKGKQGQPIIKIEVDIPQGLLALFAQYEGGEITQAQWKKAAEDIECEVEVLKAIAKVETGGPAFWRLNHGQGAYVPAILFERQYFSRLTNHQFDRKHPDVSWPVGYRLKQSLGKKDKSMHDKKVDADDIYGTHASSYLRLINAYRLDEDAALKSCSWGKFQILGENHAICSARGLKSFISTMARSEAGQLEMLAGFIQRKPQAWKDRKNRKLGKEISLHDAVKTKNWRAIAFNYNGPQYEKNRYHTRLEAAYESLKKAI